MGVQGWSWFLRKEGWVPKSDDGPCCTCSLWRHASTVESNNAFASRITVIPRGSELHVDGNGLSFILHRVAYARHIVNVLPGTFDARGSKTPCMMKKKLSKLTKEQARDLLPCFMPMELLSSVTREFVTELRDKHNMKVKVYWDGDQRRIFKAETDEKRQEQRPEEWSNFQLFCNNGVLPPVNKICEWEALFPKCRYFKAEIIETLRQCHIPQVYCEEEADGDMARAVTGQHNAYIVGQDSDFCFFPRVNYIPMETLDVSNAQMATAVVIQRSELAQELELTDENLLVEMAILMGNDYVNPLKAKFDGYNPKKCVGRAEKVLEFIQTQPPGYQVTSPSEDTQECLRFIRSLYQLESLDEYDLYERDQSKIIDEDDLDAGDLVLDPNKAPKAAKALRPSVPDEVPLELLKFDIRVDRSLKDAILRCLEAYVGNVEIENDGKGLMMTRDHLQVFRAMQLNGSASNNKKSSTPDWHPSWSDVPAAYLVEKMIALALEQKAQMAHMALPSALFNQQLFLEDMYKARKSGVVPDVVGENDDENIIDSHLAIQNKEKDFEVGEKQTLPIDEHKDRILENIANNRVTIIQGETGCGKSSRIPVMVLNAPPPDPSLSKVKIFISQPRRIAAKGLVERVRAVEPEIGKYFALRLGHGVKEYESNETRAWFCTTGYLVRLVANHPERFNDISHLIIDEIHDRGVDLDLLCLLCRRLLHVNKHIRLILMSATLAADLYQDYFDVVEPPIKVGARRFPVQESYLDDFQNMKNLSQKAKSLATGLATECDKLKCKFTPSMTYMDKLASLASHIVASIGKGGVSILIFVPGMNEIVSIIELIDQLFVPGVNFSCIPVHSEIPFEDQLDIFSQIQNDECRVIVATNSAESSVTLPALDHVIDLGLCRQIVYNEASHRQMLTSAWISRASATQRAGRTGRIREGVVYRLYTRSCFQLYMDAFEPGEMLRIPLDSVILMLKGILPSEESAGQVLLECLEPPAPSTIERSFQSLNDSRFITSPDDQGEITTLGTFVSSLGTDLSLGSLIGLGIQFGVGPEAIQLAAALSFPKPPWIISNPLVHGKREFNKMSSKTIVSRFHFDGNLNSEPFAMMNAVWDYQEAKKKDAWCWKFGMALSRIKRLSSTSTNLQRRVADLLDIPPDSLDMENPPRSMSPSKLAILRCIQVFVFHETLIEWKPKKKKTTNDGDKEYMMSLDRKSDSIQEKHLNDILLKDRHPFEIRSVKSIEQTGAFRPPEGFEASLEEISDELEERLLSYAIKRGLDLVCIWTKGVFLLLIRSSVSESGIRPVYEVLSDRVQLIGNIAGKRFAGKPRGLTERACGQWTIDREGKDMDPSISYKKLVAVGLNAKKIRSLNHDLNTTLRSCPLLKSISIHLNIQSKNSSFTIHISNTEQVSAKDLKDMMKSLEDIKAKTKETVHRQELVFPVVEQGPWVPGSDGNNNDSESFSTTWPQQMIPEGARVINALAGAARKSHVVWLDPSEATENENKEDDEEEEVSEEDFLGLYPDICGAWSRLSVGSSVYVPDLSIPASAVPMDGLSPLICCCANALDIRGGALKVEGLTLLPHGKIFSFLCLVCFGLEQDISDTMQFSGFGPEGGPLPMHERAEMLERCLKAQDLHEQSLSLGEELVCDPSFVLLLLDVFDGLRGEELKPWENLHENPCTRRSLKKARALGRSMTPMASVARRATRSKKAQQIESSVSPPAKSEEQGTPSHLPAKNGKKKPEKKSEQAAEKANGHLDYLPTTIAFPKPLQELFVTELEDGQEVKSDELPSPNILALLVQRSSKRTIRFSGKNPEWSLKQINLGDSDCFQAIFNAQGITNVHRDDVQSGTARVPFKTRPSSINDALDCVPLPMREKLSKCLLETASGLVFSSLEIAIRMECAFWLERQFKVGSKHWFQTNIDEMLKALSREKNRRRKQKKLKKSLSSASSTK